MVHPVQKSTLIAWYFSMIEADEGISEKKKAEYMTHLVEYVDEAAAPLQMVLKELKDGGVEKVGTLGFCL